LNLNSYTFIVEAYIIHTFSKVVLFFSIRVYIVNNKHMIDDIFNIYKCKQKCLFLPTVHTGGDKDQTTIVLYSTHIF